MKQADANEGDGGLRQYAKPEGQLGCEGVIPVMNSPSAAALHGRYRVPKGFPLREFFQIT